MNHIIINKKNMGLSSLSKYFKIFDLYGESVGFTIDNGNRKYNSVIGALLSVVVLAAVASQSVEKYDVLRSRGDTNYQEFSSEQREGKVLNRKETNFQIAFGIIERSTRGQTASKDFFEVQAKLLSSTGIGEPTKMEEIPLQFCNETDILSFNRNGDDGKADNYIDRIGDLRLYCFQDPDGWEISRT